MNENIEKYLKILYKKEILPKEGEDINFDFKREFITENIEEIEKRYKEANNTNEIESNNEKENAEIETEVINLNEDIKINIEEKQKEEEIKEEDKINKEVLLEVIKEIKINKYFKILHPEFKKLDREEQYYVLDDKIIIRNNIDAIDAYYLDCKIPGSGAQLLGYTDQTIIETALELFDNQERNITPLDIEQFSNNIKYEEFKNAITNIKQIANEENETKI